MKIPDVTPELLGVNERDLVAAPMLRNRTNRGEIASSIYRAQREWAAQLRADLDAEEELDARRWAWRLAAGLVVPAALERRTNA
ncbi:hypothetical protein SAMN04515671_2938 [Nakamurella panacisegetis]|uniref:Uncharacterized protein n=1 Tax=Nakamurella panacisegetis TaxID=1090615 RepID=A0A1H0Q0A8_9ACTN|nr:hypothetical protein [Nakamurella panacisegetis]SDP10166.1 hypothetical protein SAMN04515671_2938 [Nakamurella panacisegetis]